MNTRLQQIKTTLTRWLTPLAEYITEPTKHPRVKGIIIGLAVMELITIPLVLVLL
jgi:hypothetical protein